MAQLISFVLLFLMCKIIKSEGSAEDCATLYENVNFTGNTYIFREDSWITDFEEEYITPFEVINSAGSLEVKTGCALTLYTQPGFNGSRIDVKESNAMLSEEFKNFMSGSCTCQRDCNCSKIQMKSCARAYFQKGCNNTCNSEYIELRDANPTIPEKFYKKIEIIQVREGCFLSIFNEENYEGFDENKKSNIERTGTIDVNDLVGDIRSTECICNSDYVSVLKPQTKHANVTDDEISIPTTIEEVKAKATIYSNHSGLTKSLKSLKNKRSSKNVYILTLGTSRSGKSSTINFLFDNSNTTLVNGTLTSTSAIHEFRILVPVPELGIANSELRIIDTPGFKGPSKGKDRDAQFLSSLENYLDNHEDLHNRIPNVIMIFHKFYEVDFSKNSSNFISMLRGLDYFRKRITDENYSNVIFVFSHYCAETDKIQKDANYTKNRLKLFRNVIQEYTHFPMPIVVAVAENKGEQYELPMVNGYFKLPNGDIYPRNLYDKIQTAVSKGGDPVGYSVIKAGVDNSEHFKINLKTYPLLDLESSKILKFKNILRNAVFDFRNSQVSKLLDETYELMMPVFNESTVKYLQRALYLQNIRMISEIPKITVDVLELILSLEYTEENIQLLQKALNLKPPKLQNILTGFGFNFIKDYPLPETPFEISEFKISEIGYRLPSIVTSQKFITNEVKDFFEIVSVSDYFKKRFNMSTIPKKFSLKPGFNNREDYYYNNSCRVTALREIRTFELTLNDKTKGKLSHEFILNVETRTTDWKSFFALYGTHIVTKVFGGGSIQIEMTSNKSCNSSDLIKLASEDLFEQILWVEDMDKMKPLEIEGVQYKLEFKGGDVAYHTTDFSNMDFNEASKLLQNWKDSLRYSPSVLTTEMSLMSMGEFVKEFNTKGQRFSSVIENALVGYSKL